MRRISRISVVLLVLVLIVVVAAFVAVRFLPDSELIRKTLEAELQSATGGKVSLQSAGIYLTFPGPVVLTLKGLTIRTTAERKLVSIRRVDLVPDLYDLVRRRLSIKSITVYGLHSSVVRDRDGRVWAPTLPLVAGTGKPQVTRPSGPPVKWSVREIRFYNGTIEWVDKYVSREKDLVIRVTDISGLVDRLIPGAESPVYFSARLGSEKGVESVLRLEGSLLIAPDQSGLERVKVTCFSDSVGIDPFLAYLPVGGLDVGKFPRPGFRAELSWLKDESRVVPFKAAITFGTKRKSKLNFDGKAVIREDSSGLQEVQCRASTESLPLAVFSKLFPPESPVDPRSGFLRGEVRGQWTQAANWTAAGALGFEEIVPIGRFKTFGKMLRVWARFRMDPEDLLINGLEVSDASRLISVTGKVSGPLFEQPVLDLSAQASIRPEWIKALDLKLPKTCRIDGLIPLRARVTGTMQNVHFRINADMTRATFAVKPYAEKPSGKKATVSAQGNCVLSRTEGGLKASVKASTKAEVEELRLRRDKQSQPLPRTRVRFEARVWADDTSVSIRESRISLGRVGEREYFFKGGASLLWTMTPSPSIKGTLTTVLDMGIVRFLELKLPEGVKVKGSVPVKVQYSGRPGRLHWALDAALGKLAVSREKAFRKPEGVEGNLTAQGSSIHGTVTLKEAALSLPPMVLKTRTIEPSGKNENELVALELEQWDLATMSPYVDDPNLKASSGPVKAKFALKRTESGIVPSGVIEVVNVRMQREHAPWTLENISGTIEVNGESANIRGIRGEIKGACQGKWRLTGALNYVMSPARQSGRFSLELGKGKIKAIRLVTTLTNHHSVLGRLIQPRPIALEGDFIKLNSVRGDFSIKGAKATTDNFRSLGPGLFSGIVGTLDMRSLQLDILMGNNTVVVGSDTLSRIPGMRKWLSPEGSSLIKVAVDTYARLTGSVARSLNIVPLHADTINPTALEQLRKLMH
jgi:hypothetical protein